MSLNQKYQQLNAGQRSLIRKELHKATEGLPIGSSTAGQRQLKRVRQLARRYGVTAATIAAVWADGPQRTPIKPRVGSIEDGMKIIADARKTAKKVFAR